MKTKRYHFYSLVLSLLLLSLAIALLFVNEWLSNIIEPKAMVRKIETIALKPPPPPPPNQVTKPLRPALTMKVSGAGPSLAISLVKPKLDLLTIKSPSIDSTQPIKWEDQLTVDWNALALDELDNEPQLLTNLKAPFPNSLKRKGITSIDVLLEVIIDETGKVTLVSILENPYIEFENILYKLIKRARFTAPKKDGQPARVKFNWPLGFNQS
jgi:TonB family protein